MTERTLAERLAARQKTQEGGQAPRETSGDQERPAPPPKTLTAADVLRQQQQAANADTSVLFIDIELIDVESQIRTEFDEDYCTDLALDFVHSGAYQPKQPITVFRRGNGRFLLDDGENRLRAMKFADAHRVELGITDPTAFKSVRATVLQGPEPSKLERLQSQARANLLRDSLNDVDLASAVSLYMNENPAASKSDAAKWVGFVNLESGRVKVHNALRILECDADLIDDVRKGALASSRALMIQAERNKECGRGVPAETVVLDSVPAVQPTDNSTSGKMLEKAKAGKKSVSMSLDMENLKLASEIILTIAKSLDVDLKGIQGEMDRKFIAALFSADNLRDVLGRLK